ncbi:MAG: AAA family ATPase [Gammaproteobacteria bacterium]|nr:AAA family ATPase [Gammaproteobacteria bacterium]
MIDHPMEYSANVSAAVTYLDCMSNNFKLATKEVDSGQACLFITGSNGSGKSTLAKMILYHYESAHLISGNQGTSVHNITKFIATHLGINLYSNSEEHTNRGTQLINQLKQSCNECLFIIDDAHLIPGSTLSVIMQLINIQDTIRFVLIGDNHFIDKADALSIGNYKKSHFEIEPLSYKDTKLLLLNQYQLKLSGRKLKQLLIETKGNPSQIETYIKKKDHLKKINLKIYLHHLTKHSKDLFLMTAGALVLATGYFAFEHFSPKHSNINIVLSKQSNEFQNDFAPSVCYPNMSTTEKIKNVDNIPLYVVQLLSVRKPSSIQNISKSLRSVPFKPVMIKNKKSGLYTLYYGPFFTREDAKEALAHLPDGLKTLNPWIRPVDQADLA